jgi:uncharacterized damage-inducible protein DinB
MNLQEVQTLLEYHYWARDRLLDAVERLTPHAYRRDLGNSFPSIRDTVVHLYGADWVWRCRWEGDSPDAMPDAVAYPDPASLRAAWREEERHVRSIVTRLGEQGIARTVEYRRTADAKPQAQIFWQQLQHLVNHGSYHRGQVTTMLRQIGAAPPLSMDLIAFYRERANVTA